MAADSRKKTVLAMGKGILGALGITFCAMALLALLVVRLGLSDKALTAMNQVIKVVSILGGVWVCVGRGGQRGFALGAVTGLLYMVIAYGLYCLLDGQLVPALTLTGEFLMGAGLGALSGALVANLPAGRKKSRRRGKTGKIRAQAA